MPGVQSRRWSATWNNYDEDYESTLNSLLERKLISYLIYGLEIGKEGTPHLQMYFELPKKKTLRGLKAALLNESASLNSLHLEISKGDLSSNQEYCKKDGQWFQFGTPMTNGTKRSILEVSEAIKNGASLKTIATDFTDHFIRYPRGIEKAIELLNNDPRDFKSYVKVYIGATGTGKSRKAHEDDKITWTHHGDRWFDGYQGQESVLFDDFDGIKSGIPFRKLLQITDRYPLSVPYKGGFANWRPRVIVFTTNVEPDQWYPGEDFAPLSRRIDEIVRFRSLVNE